jgi:hypothetical protein
MLSAMLAESGITLATVPACRAPTVTTAVCKRFDVARHHALQGHHQAAGDEHRVHGQVRPCRMPAAAVDGDVRRVAGGHEGPAAEAEIAGRHARVVVQAEDGVARKALEQAVFDHALRATAQPGFFGRLEHQVHRAAEVARARQLLRRAQQHGGVAVVAAGMHHAGVAAGVGLAGGFGDGQGVHVGAHGHAARARAPRAQRAHHAVAADAACHRPAPVAQVARHQRGRVRFLERQFRVLVDVLPRRRQEPGIAGQVAQLAKAAQTGVHRQVSPFGREADMAQPAVARIVKDGSPAPGRRQRGALSSCRSSNR